MNENKHVLGSNFKKIDSHDITPEEYEEIPELTDDFFENAIWKIGGSEVSPEIGKATARKAHLVRKEKRINTNVVEQS